MRVRFQATYCVRYPQAMPFLRYKMTYSLLKLLKILLLEVKIPNFALSVLYFLAFFYYTPCMLLLSRISPESISWKLNAKFRLATTLFIVLLQKGSLLNSNRDGRKTTKIQKSRLWKLEAFDFN